MPFLRFNRDRRGYESTFLLHARGPGQRPELLYWYRTAPGMRIGRPALDDEAIRTIEAQHTDLEFDWPAILEVGAATTVEVERELPPRTKRSFPVSPVDAEFIGAAPQSRSSQPPGVAPAVPDLASSGAALSSPLTTPASNASQTLLEQLVGGENAARLRARFAEITSRIEALHGDQAVADRLRIKARALNPGTWLTAADVLVGVQGAASTFDELRRELSES